MEGAAILQYATYHFQFSVERFHLFCYILFKRFYSLTSRFSGSVLCGLTKYYFVDCKYNGIYNYALYYS